MQNLPRVLGRLNDYGSAPPPRVTTAALQSDSRPFWIATLRIDAARGFAAINGVAEGNLRVIRQYSDALAVPSGATVWVLGEIDRDIAAGLSLVRESRAGRVRYADADEVIDG